MNGPAGIRTIETPCSSWIWGGKGVGEGMVVAVDVGVMVGVAEGTLVAVDDSSAVKVGKALSITETTVED